MVNPHMMHTRLTSVAMQAGFTYNKDFTTSKYRAIWYVLDEAFVTEEKNVN
jgi:hypothetical protein